MKKNFLLFSLVFATGTALAQEGVILFEVRINIHRNIPADREGMKAIVPEFRTFKQQLFFNASESFYQPVVEEEEEEDEPGNGGGRRVMRFRQRAEVYFNQSTGKITSRQDIMGKDYLIADSLRVAPWKFGSETKTVLGYECKQAYYTDEERSQTITAWFTDQLRPMLGPERFNTLPGAVLAVDINNGERVLVATKVTLRPLKKNELKEPSHGEKTTPAEFRKMMEENMKRMGHNGSFIIRN